MRIIIVGAGAVGTHLAKLLSNEKQDITLIDDSAEKLSKLESNFDLLTIEGVPTSIKTLKDAGVNGADLFVAVTPEEGRNITACIIAHSLGAKKTLARVDNYEYIQPRNRDFFKGLGIDSLIYPEMLAAREIADSLRLSWIRQWAELCNGALVMLGVKVREGSMVVNHAIKDLPKEQPYHVVAIKRGEETLIPRGSDEILPNDLVYFMALRKTINYLSVICGKEAYQRVKNVMIMGGSRIAVRAAELVSDTMSVKIIESDRNRCEWLTARLPSNVMVINGDGRDKDLLLQEGINSTQAFVALTDNAETNILTCLSTKQYGTFKTIAEVENIDFIGMAENLDIGSVINKKKIAASYIYQMLLDADVDNVKSLTLANADVAEFTVAEKARVTRGLVRDIDLPRGATFGGLVRDGVGMLVNGDTQIMAGDHVVVFCLDSMIQRLEKYFN
ncbi:MAG: Trk system potassium transporter TrkA [Bacteroidaceae bacterium]|nr:Trk system potassium transporter TrkA [Bacteroidaceae bacterium]